MTTQPFPPLYSRLDPEITARTRRQIAEAKATKTQSALEYFLFAVFGATILIAAIALVITNSAGFRRVPNRVAEGIAADRVNILVMQTVRNAKTDDVNADALLLLSVKPSTHEAALTSIPRDLWVKLGKYGQRRLADAPAVGKSSGYPGEGAGLTADTIQSAFGQPVHAYVSVDRAELANAVDAVGGIDVNNEQSFLEFKKHERFRRGAHHLDGEHALLYANSPWILGPANDRFAREGRQQQVIAALVAKASVSNPAVLSSQLGEHSNLTPRNVAWLRDAMRGRTARRVTLAPYMETFEVATMADIGEAVRPRDATFHQIRAIVANVFGQTATN